MAEDMSSLGKNKSVFLQFLISLVTSSLLKITDSVISFTLALCTDFQAILGCKRIEGKGMPWRERERERDDERRKRERIRKRVKEED
jgi:hypothetical protein